MAKVQIDREYVHIHESWFERIMKIDARSRHVPLAHIRGVSQCDTPCLETPRGATHLITLELTGEDESMMVVDVEDDSASSIADRIRRALLAQHAEHRP